MLDENNQYSIAGIKQSISVGEFSSLLSGRKAGGQNNPVNG
jgi:hypothetical protein